MKKPIALLIFLSLALLCAACSQAPTAPPTEQQPPAEQTAPPADIRIGALKGPTAMGMVKMMEDNDDGLLTDNNYSFTVAAAIDEVTPAIAQGELDIAAVPANLSSVLYNNDSVDVQVLAINTLGVLYIVGSDDSVQNISDLEGKTIYASGKGATPEYALQYILAGNGLSGKVTLEWLPEHAACVAALLNDPDGIAMLPQPFVTTAQAQNENLRTVLDLTAEWDALQKDGAPGALITGVIVARAEFVRDNPEAVNAFLDHYRDSVAFANSGVPAAAALMEKYDIVPAAVAEKALPFCNIVFIDGAEMKEKLSGYLAALMEQNPQAVGGVLPADDFYY
ncbi:MAG: ABC transporter substrate-binding protein, partial [Gracilibacteraceae bacterium]|nr:ABC transporter substrate-binding protein [Gracilibacteraceae bacterium]